MEALKIVLTGLEVIASLVLIVVVLFQSGKEAGLDGLSILGLPLKIQTPQTSSEQPKERIEEPSNALSENMYRRHEDLPERWFKVAYYTPIGTDLMLSVYVDPDDDKTYAFDDFATEPYRTWDSLDECLCSIYEELKDGPAEKEFKRK